MIMIVGQLRVTLMKYLVFIKNNIASDICLSRNVVNKGSKRSRRFVHYFVEHRVRRPIGLVRYYSNYRSNY